MKIKKESFHRRRGGEGHASASICGKCNGEACSYRPSMLDDEEEQSEIQECSFDYNTARNTYDKMGFPSLFSTLAFD